MHTMYTCVYFFFVGFAWLILGMMMMLFLIAGSALTHTHTHKYGVRLIESNTDHRIYRSMPFQSSLKKFFKEFFLLILQHKKGYIFFL